MPNVIRSLSISKLRTVDKSNNYVKNTENYTKNHQDVYLILLNVSNYSILIYLRRPLNWMRRTGTRIYGQKSNLNKNYLFGWVTTVPLIKIYRILKNTSSQLETVTLTIKELGTSQVQILIVCNSVTAKAKVICNVLHLIQWSTLKIKWYWLR